MTTGGATATANNNEGKGQENSDEDATRVLEFRAK